MKKKFFRAVFGFCFVGIIFSLNQGKAEAPASGVDDFAEFENSAPESTTTSAPNPLENMSELDDPDPLGVMEKKGESSDPNSLPLEDEMLLEENTAKKAEKKTEHKTAKEVPKKTETVPPTEILPAKPIEKPIEKPIAEPEKMAQPSPEPQPTTEPIPEPKVETAISVPAPEPKISQQQIVRDDPNFKAEKRFHDLYKKYYLEPTNVESWEKAVGSRRSEKYNVQKGDTLWDLSQTFFGDPNYWPKVWSINKEEILNPHQVDPKMTIRFFPGSVDDAPTIGILTQDKANEPMQTPQNLSIVDPSSSAEVSRQIQPPSVRPVGRIPPSMPLYRMGAVHKAPIEFQLDKRTEGMQTFHSPVQYMMLDKFPLNVGKIEEAESGLNSAADFQYVFVELADGNPRTMMVVKEKEKLNEGVLVEIQGEIQVLDRVSDKRNLFRAIVKKTLSLVQVGSSLIDGAIPSYDLSVGEDNRTGSPVQILGGIYGSQMTVFGRNSYLFLGAGKKQGIQIGQSLSVFKNLAVRVPGTKISYIGGTTGKVKVIAADENVSTGYVVENQESIQKGDWVGAPGKIIHALTKESEQPSPSSGTASTQGDENPENMLNENDLNEVVPAPGSEPPASEPPPLDSSSPLDNGQQQEQELEL